MSFGSYCHEKSHAVVQEVHSRLQRRLHNPVFDVSCDYHGGVLLLRGKSKSYYEKQAAQEAARGVAGVARVVNNIDVVARSA